MATLTVFDRTGKQVGNYDLDPAELAPRISKQLLHEAVIMYQSNQRLGTAKTKSRAEVAGSTKKMYRQKGTGNARAGSRRSGVRVGGGHIFAKRPRDWTYRLPRKALQMATRMALAAKVRDNEVTIIDDLAFAAPKTREMTGILKALGLSGGSLLVATADHNINVYKSARNIDRVSITPISGLNAWNVLTPRRVLITRAALDAFRSKSRSKADSTDGADSAKPAKAAKPKATRAKAAPATAGAAKARPAKTKKA
jgi:large subunit ribosomal protein L4